jgi:ribosomal protein S18 acetylase RimI-like enzyme
VLSWVFGGDDQARAVKLQSCFGFLAAEVNVPMGASFVAEGGCACWTPSPGIDEWPQERGARFAGILSSCCDDGDLRRLGVLSSTMDRFHPHEAHWYLGTIATRRDRQGLGIGTSLLAHSLAIVDAEGAPAYLESTNPRNVPLYQRHGFRITGVIDLPDGPSLTAMWRDPGGRP